MCKTLLKTKQSEQKVTGPSCARQHPSVQMMCGSSPPLRKLCTLATQLLFQHVHAALRRTLPRWREPYPRSNPSLTTCLRRLYPTALPALICFVCICFASAPGISPPPFRFLLSHFFALVVSRHGVLTNSPCGFPPFLSQA